jgi:hypothetical protein
VSWHYSLALEEAFSEACSLDGAPSAPWRSTPTALDDSCSDRMKGTCHRSPFGMMFVPSTDAHGEAVLTWFREGFPARTSASQEKARASAESVAGYGAKWPASFARYNRDTHSWKTAQLSLFEDLERSLEIWPRWGWMQGGVCWAASQPAFVSNESGSGLSVQAPTASDCYDPRFRLKSLIRPHHPNGNLKEQWAQRYQTRITPTVTEILMTWPEGWTDCAPLETGRFHSWLNSHGRYYMTDTDPVQTAYRPNTELGEGGTSTSSPLWPCPDCDGCGTIAARSDDMYRCPEHRCETCGGSGEVADLKKAVWGDVDARDHK